MLTTQEVRCQLLQRILRDSGLLNQSRQSKLGDCKLLAKLLDYLVVVMPTERSICMCHIVLRFFVCVIQPAFFGRTFLVRELSW